MNRTPNGYYKRQDISKTETNIDFLLTYTDKWGDFGFMQMLEVIEKIMNTEI